MRILFLFFLFVVSGTLCSQQIISVKRDRTFAFFQSGIGRDTISKNKGDLFVFHVPDSMMSYLVISVENGKLDLKEGDTLLRFTYVRGHKYESILRKEEDKIRGKEVYKFITAVNGASLLPEKEVLITFYDKRKPGKIILENRFVFVK